MKIFSIYHKINIRPILGNNSAKMEKRKYIPSIFFSCQWEANAKNICCSGTKPFDYVPNI